MLQFNATKKGEEVYLLRYLYKPRHPQIILKKRHRNNSLGTYNTNIR